MRGLRGTLVALVLTALVATTGCGTTGGPTRAVDRRPATTDAATPDRTPRTPRPADEPRAGQGLTRDDRALARAFGAFASRPSAETAARVPFAPVVWLGLGENLFVSVPRKELADAGTWGIDVDAYGRIGPLDALQPVRRQTRTAGPDGVAVSVGPRPQCVGPSTASPARFRDARQVVLRPAAGTTASCLDWFAVDLYVASDGLVRAVTVQYWEP